MAGYGFVWLPPSYRADQGNFSVGYDVYDRFDLGGPGRPTLYGTEEGLKAVARSLHRANLSLHVDFVINHNGFSNLGTPGFVTAGGYPGLAITLPNDIDGDFHSAFAGGDIKERLGGLIDIAHEKDHQFIRSPVTPGDARNISAGTTPSFGRLANVPDLANRRFYPQIGHNTIFVFDPRTNEAFRYTASISKIRPPEILSLRTRWDTSCATRNGWCRSSELMGSASTPRSMSRGSCSTCLIALSTARIRESSSMALKVMSSPTAKSSMPIRPFSYR